MLILTTLASIVQLGNGYPKATDRAERWQLRLDTGDLRFYRAADTGAGYWILVYEVTNETDKDHRWIPQFDLVTDKGEIIPDGNDVPRSVKLAVLAIFGDPLMQSQSDASGPLLQGEENAIRSVAIWKAGREDIREVQVFAGGVSGDTADIIHPISGEKTKLHRVLQFSWGINGEIDDIIMKPLPRRPVDGGVSIRTPLSKEGVTRKWVFR
jgi:hypothetical protein|tara:strand:- start:157 stop:789 length:633 start_codon:yes stop_codon:yes gene_type:complete